MLHQTLITSADCIYQNCFKVFLSCVLSFFLFLLLDPRVHIFYFTERQKARVIIVTIGICFFIYFLFYFIMYLIIRAVDS